MTTVLDCIERVPILLRRVKESYPERRKAVSAYLTSEKVTYVDKVIFIASGSSYNSAHMAKLFIKKYCHLQAELKYPNIFVKYEAELELDSQTEGREVYVVISQGGETRLVYEALEKSKLQTSPVLPSHRIPILPSPDWQGFLWTWGADRRNSYTEPSVFPLPPGSAACLACP